MSEPTNSILKAPISKTRLEFLYDGIFAIAMTILVLELKVPELAERRSAAELWHHLVQHRAAFGSWLLSIVMLGIFWFQHQRLYRCLHHITRTSLLIHLWLMATAAFFPFSAALIGHYPGNRVALLAYMGCAWLHIAALTTLWIVAERQGTLDPELDPAEITRVRNRQLMRTGGLLALFVVYFLFWPSV